LGAGESNPTKSRQTPNADQIYAAVRPGVLRSRAERERTQTIS
jgi:hypothetical protein